jgi:hypothetical protein
LATQKIGGIYMKKKKILKIIGIILLVVIAVFLIHSIRNYVIITNLQNKVSKYVDSTNYHTKYVTTSDNGTNITINYYKKDNKQHISIERELNGEKSTVLAYDNGDGLDMFIESNDSKIAKLGSGTLLEMYNLNYIETESNWQTFLWGSQASIKSTQYNGKECYIVKGFESSMAIAYDSEQAYINKETGLVEKLVSDDSTSERVYEYEFDNVDDSIFVEPDISQYTLQ